MRPTVDMVVGGIDLDRHQIHLAMTHAAFGGNLFRQRAHVSGCAA